MSEQGQLPSYPAAGHEPTGTSTPAYAGWGRRALAFLLDGILVTLVAVAITGLTHHHQPWDLFTFHTVHGQRRLVPVGTKLYFYGVVDTVVAFAYGAGFLSSTWQATPFMRLCRIRIASETGDRVGLGRAAGRTAIFQAATLVATRAAFLELVILVDLLWPLWDARNQTVHDKLARTVVLREAAP